MADPSHYARTVAEARQALRGGSYRRAGELAQRAVTAMPDEGEAHHLAGLACLCLDEWDEADVHLRQVPRSEPRHAECWTNLGALLNRRGRYDEAIEALRQSLRIDPAGAVAFFNLGVAYSRLKQPTLAVQAYQECIRLMPSLAQAHKNLAHLLLQLHRVTPAIDHYHTALRLAPHLDGARLGLARARTMAAADRNPSLHSEQRPPVQPESLPQAQSDQQRREVFSTVYNLAVHGDALTQEWLRIHDVELSPVLTDLSKSFVDPDPSKQEQRIHFSQFVRAVKRYEAFQTQLTENCEKIQRQVRRLSTD